MKKDIPVHQVSEVGIAIVPDFQENISEIFVINSKNQPLTDILICSRAFGEIEGKKIETSTLRYHLKSLESERSVRFEMIENDLLEISNEYWISFFMDGYMYDRKIVFVPGTISLDFFTDIPFTDKKGIMII